MSESGKPLEMFVILFDDMLLISRRKKALSKKVGTVVSISVDNPQKRVDTPLHIGVCTYAPHTPTLKERVKWEFKNQFLLFQSGYVSFRFGANVF